MAVGLGNIAETLKDAVGDLSSLDVTTFTGDISALINNEKVDPSKEDSEKKPKIQWDNFLSEATQKKDGVAIKGAVSLALATHVKIDGDATHFVTSNEIPDYVIKTHAEAVKNGLEYRNQIINFLGGKVAGLLE